MLLIFSSLSAYVIAREGRYAYNSVFQTTSTLNCLKEPFIFFLPINSISYLKCHYIVREAEIKDFWKHFLFSCHFNNAFWNTRSKLHSNIISVHLFILGIQKLNWGQINTEYCTVWLMGQYDFLEEFCA